MSRQAKRDLLGVKIENQYMCDIWRYPNYKGFMFTFHQGNLTPKTGQEWLSCWRSVNGLASHRCYPFRPNKTKVTKSVFTRAYACVCVCVRACVCVWRFPRCWWLGDPWFWDTGSLLEFPWCSGGILSAGRGQCVHCVKNMEKFNFSFWIRTYIHTQYDLLLK